ncbi:MAG: FkbM family methyltransferase [Thermoanaerobaculia bacterium]
MKLRSSISRILSSSPLAYFPVKVRRGPARGARWTLLPFSANWRLGGEADLAAGLALLSSLRGSVCWDFGAHFGIHAVGMAMQVGSEGQVVAFEPDPGAFTRLVRHVRMNRLQNVVLFPAAVSRASGTSTLITVHGVGSSFSHFRYEDEPAPADGATLAVETVAPDELVATEQIRLPDLIKVDVQGHGAQALEGSIDTIRACHPIVIFSSHSPWELEGVRNLLEPLGYGVVSLRGERLAWGGLAHETGILLAGEPSPGR